MLGPSIRRRRLDAGLTLVALADRSGLSQPFLSQVETGKATPSIDSLQRIAQALGTTPQGLLQAHHSTGAVDVLRADGDERLAQFRRHRPEMRLPQPDLALAECVCQHQHLSRGVVDVAVQADNA